MDYIELDFEITPREPFAEILVAQLAEMEFESFTDTTTGIKAFIKAPLFDEDQLRKLHLIRSTGNCKIAFKKKLIPEQNWNSEWEKSFDPIIIDDKCVVRSPFHDKPPVEIYDIVITPKMSFGTGHHDTTFLMLSEMLDLNLKNKSVLDMGCGTAVLAILAEKMGAKNILAIDVDEWSYKNSIENIEQNNCNRIKVKQGDAHLLKDNSFDVVLANINRNVLLDDMPDYANTLNNGGTILLSGFFKSDVPSILGKASLCGLQFDHEKTKNEWTLLKFVKI